MAHLEGSRVVRGAFIGVACTFVLLGAMGVVREEQARQESRDVIARSVRSVELEARLRGDIDDLRWLIAMHILQLDVASMNATEARIRAADADFDTTSHRYETLMATRSRTSALWRSVGDERAALAKPIDELLALSHVNRDVEARAALAPIETRFSSIVASLRTLGTLDREDTEASLDRADHIQRRSAAVQALFAALGVVVTAILGAWAARVVGERDRASRRHTLDLEERNHELDAFAGRVAHDLRGPLSTITLSLSPRPDRAADDHATLDLLRRASARMAALIEDLLAFSRAGAEAHAGSSAIADVIDGVREEVEARDPSARILVDVEPARIACRETLVRQVVANLVGNGIKYHRPDQPPQVEVLGHIVGDHYELRVRDNGVGMAPEDAHRAFEPFYRAPAMQWVQGTGLGLAIAKRVVEACGGSIVLETAPGLGTTAVVRLPCAGADDGTVRTALAED